MSRENEDRLPVVGIVGLSSLSISLGLALQAVKTRYELVGHDPDADNVRRAKEAGAVDRTHWNLVEVVERADLLFLAEPEETTLETLKAVAGHLKPGSLVTDLLPAKIPVMQAAKELLPDHASFVGGHPIVEVPREPSAQIFQGATYCLTPLADADEAAVKVISRLVSAIGAAPYFIDAAEHDGLWLSVGPLPYLLSAALLKVVAGSPSARDIKKLSGDAFEVIVDRGSDVGAYRNALSAAPEALAAWLDAVLFELGEVRTALATGDEAALRAFVEEAAASRDDWARAVDTPETSEAVRELQERNLVMDTLFGQMGRWRRRGNEE